MAIGSWSPAWPLPTVAPKFSTSIHRAVCPFPGCELWHPGVDLTGAPSGAVVVAPEDGVLDGIDGWIEGTLAIYLRTDSGLFLVLGGISKDSPRELGFTIHQRIKRGDKLGTIAGSEVSLHIEAYRADTGRSRPSRWWHDDPPPTGLLNPSSYIERMVSGLTPVEAGPSPFPEPPRHDWAVEVISPSTDAAAGTPGPANNPVAPNGGGPPGRWPSLWTIGAVLVGFAALGYLDHRRRRALEAEFRAALEQHRLEMAAKLAALPERIAAAEELDKRLAGIEERQAAADQEGRRRTQEMSALQAQHKADLDQVRRAAVDHADQRVAAVEKRQETAEQENKRHADGLSALHNELKADREAIDRMREKVENSRNSVPARAIEDLVKRLDESQRALDENLAEVARRVDPKVVH
jgi:hypothetical protein